MIMITKEVGAARGVCGFPSLFQILLFQASKEEAGGEEFSEEFLANYFSVYYLAVARNCVQMLEFQFYKSGCTALIINCTEKLTSVQFII